MWSARPWGFLVDVLGGGPDQGGDAAQCFAGLNRDEMSEDFVRDNCCSNRNDSNCFPAEGERLYDMSVEYVRCCFQGLYDTDEQCVEEPEEDEHVASVVLMRWWASSTLSCGALTRMKVVVNESLQGLQKSGWGKAKLTKDFMDAIDAGFSKGRNKEGNWDPQLCRLWVREGQVSTSCDLERMATSHIRALFRQLIILNFHRPLPEGLDFFVSTSDIELEDYGFPVLAKRRRAMNDNASSSSATLLVPDEWLLHDWGKKLNTFVRINSNGLKWSDKKDVLFWRGGLTNFWHCETPLGERCRFDTRPNLANFYLWPRGRIVLLSQMAGGGIDAKFNKVWQPEIEKVAEDQGWLAPSASYEDFLKRKYLWNDEHTDAIFWRFQSNSLNFLTVGSFTSWLLPGDKSSTRMLEPCDVLSEAFAFDPAKPCHYIPVLHDQSDLMPKLEWAKQHDDQARRIAEAASHASRAAFNPNAVLRYLSLLLEGYHDLLQRT